MAQDTLEKRLRDALLAAPALLQGDAFSAAELTANRPFVTPTEMWMRAPRLLSMMRTAGVPEEMLTGRGADFEKMQDMLGALALHVGSTLPGDIYADMAWLQEKELTPDDTPATLWQRIVTRMEQKPITPESLLSQYRAALLQVSITAPQSLAAFSHHVRPLLDLTPLLSAGFPDTAKALSAAYAMPASDLASLEALLGVAVSRFAAAKSPAMVLDISGFAGFVRPDPYHAAGVLDRHLAGKALTADERALLLAQLLRTLGRAARENNICLVLRVRPKTAHVWGDFSPRALKKLLSYLADIGAMPSTLLALPAGELPTGLSLLLDCFTGEGAPRLDFGIDGAGARSAALRRSLRYFLSRGAASRLVGITDCDKGHFTAPTHERFCRVLAAELADFAKNDMPAGFPEAALFSTAHAILWGRAVSLFNLK